MLALAAPAFAQVPFLPDEDRLGRPEDGFALSICVDRRDGASVVDEAIGRALGAALLLDVEMHVIESDVTREPVDNLYRHLREDCRLYLGLKLLADFYPDWLALTGPYYQVGYAYVARDPAIARLGDIPRSAALAPAMGSSADLQLLQYLGTLPSDQRWRRFPYGDDRKAIASVLDGTSAAALVWAPTFWALARTDPAIAALHIIAPEPLPEVMIPVGAALLSGNEGLRAQVDEAIAAILADGTVAAILKEQGFPAKLP